jgi:glycine cleavage system aminomethyltransferase T
VTGKDRNAFLEVITVADMKSLEPFRGSYSFMPNEKGVYF